MTTDRGHQPLYFLHIPKTAGTTLIAILEAQFPREEICPAHLWRDLLKISPSDMAKYQLFRGHFYHYVDRILPEKPVYMTMLRDPIERSLSHYEHVRRESGHYFHHKVISMRYGLGEFVRDPETSPMIANFQTRSIALDLDPVSLAGSMTEADIDALRLERMLESAMPEGISDTALLERAKERLTQFAVVGLTERFQESVALLCHTFGWDPAIEYANRRVSTQRLKQDQVSRDVIGVIRQQTRLDAELYEYAQQLFAARLNEMSEH